MDHDWDDEALVQSQGTGAIATPGTRYSTLPLSLPLPCVR